MVPLKIQMKGSGQYNFLGHCSKDWRLRQSWMRNEEINRAKGKETGRKEKKRAGQVNDVIKI